MVDWKDPVKSVVRDDALDFKREHGFSVLMLPGKDCCDLIQAVEEGLIDPKKDRLVVVERDPKIMEGIIHVVRKLGFKIFDEDKVYFHRGDLISLNWYLATGDGQFNFVYLDICNPLTVDITAFLATIPNDVLAPGCRFAINASKGRLNDRWFDVIDNCKVNRWSKTIKNRTWNVSDDTEVPWDEKGPNYHCLMTFGLVHVALGMNYVTKFLRGRMYKQLRGTTWMFHGEFEIVRPEAKRTNSLVKTKLGKAICFHAAGRCHFPARIVEALFSEPDSREYVDREVPKRPAKYAHLSPQKWAWHPANPSGIRRYQKT